MIRTAVVGFGVSGRIFHAPFLAADDAYSLDFIVTGNADRARQAADEYPHATVVSSPEALFERASAVDLVVIGTPPVTHAGLAATALDHGLHVVVDKPFAVSSAQGEVLIEHARRVGRVLTVFQNRRWDGDFLTLRKLIDDGELGAVHTFESRFEWWKPQGPRDWKAGAGVAEGGGILFDLGTHLIDQACQVFGPVADVHADVLRRGAGAGDDDTFLVLTHENGVRSRLFMTGLAALPGPRFHVLGEKAAYTKHGLDPQEDALKNGARPGDDGFGREQPENWGTLGVRGGTRRIEPEPGDYGRFYRLLATALDGGALPVDPRDAVDVLRIIERAHARKGDLSR
ncbi:Gfo/Idh/MocA family oxidoreductase [Amycolatopsis endophytica]|uniref:Putative dehydrogenase n=1 Tax=Amycolatopsis endophytica TaxID=860233 RepID=A0A853BF69_9PSEU|nr:Gfo/Idh/MocA family oxidoreductase [Amycolatopsis endophytica]NYI93291.1 putative dehydrogenase [Amycolatopsis endophytica]